MSAQQHRTRPAARTEPPAAVAGRPSSTPAHDLVGNRAILERLEPRDRLRPAVEDVGLDLSDDDEMGAAPAEDGEGQKPPEDPAPGDAGDTTEDAEDADG